MSCLIDIYRGEVFYKTMSNRFQVRNQRIQDRRLYEPPNLSSQVLLSRLVEATNTYFESNGFSLRVPNIKKDSLLVISGHAWHSIGRGDWIWMMRWYPQFERSPNPIYINCQPEVTELLKPQFPKLFYPGDSLPQGDRIKLIQPRPHWFVPARAYPPYIKATKKSSLPPNPNKIRIGVCWTSTNLDRVIPLSLLIPLLRRLTELPVELVNLTLEPPPGSVPMLQPLISDFADLAAVLSTCCLIISSDTAQSNLAGSMGIGGYVLLPYDYDLRWGVDGINGSISWVSPWYPTLRFVRGKNDRNWKWEQVIAALEHDLVLATEFNSVAKTKPRCAC